MTRRGWASLVTGTKTVRNSNAKAVRASLINLQVIQAMHPWRHESLFADYIAEHSPMPSKNFMLPMSSPVSPEARREHLAIIADLDNSFQRLQPYLNRHDQEGKWIDQLRGYIDRLRTMGPAQTAEEQFNLLYILRKWTFWVPISLLAAKRNDVTVMVVLGHLYATALAVEPMFPDIGGVFCANLALPPLQDIVKIVSSYQDHGYDQHTQAMSYMIQYPAETAASYKSRRDWARQQAGDAEPVQQNPYTLDTLNLDFENHLAHYSYGQSLSPAFAPSPLSFMPPPGLVSGQQSPYLEVPRTTVDAFGASSYASPLGSPATAPPHYVKEETNVFSFNSPMGYPSGFVATPTVWT